MLSFSYVPSVFLASALEPFPIRRNHLIEKESDGFKELEHFPIEKAKQLSRRML
jgi:hypothetical protein